ncbi:hypothetical protein C8F01DRAFT_101281 [Mycena amicta]|nr:hypothetical protein C8F01DRAFT_101281 [Mycena amicta]
MHAVNRVRLRLILATLLPCLVSGQVTLWQFGEPRLFGGVVTLPLIPLGTAPGGAATTYRYQAVNPTTVVTVEGASFVTQTLPVTVTRTIIASASGWLEPFPDRTGNIACGFVDSTFGECFDGGPSTTTLHNSGPPTPEVFAVSTSQPTSNANPTSRSFISTTFGGVTLGTPSSTGATGPSPSQPSKPSAGPIVGGVIGGVAVLALAVLALILCRRRRRMARESDLNLEKAQPFTLRSSGFGIPIGPSSQTTAGQDGVRAFTLPSHAVAVTHATSPPGPYPQRPHAPQQSTSSAGISSDLPYAHTSSNPDTASSQDPNRPLAGNLKSSLNANGTNMTTPELVRMLYQRVQTENADANEAESPPPTYSLSTNPAPAVS